MNMYEMAYEDTFAIEGKELKGTRDNNTNIVKIPYSITPDIGIGDIISQKAGKREISLKVIDVAFKKNSTLKIGTGYPHMLSLTVENTTAQPHIANNENSTFNIGSISGEQVQIGNHNKQITNIQLQQLIEQVSKSNDDDAKLLLKSLLQNSTVASVVGASVSALLSLL